MVKAIELIMCEDRAIQINVNGDSKLKIVENKRSISAQQIYEILCYKSGDNFDVNMKNDIHKDEQVLIFFKGLFEEICSRIGKFQINE